MSFGSYLRAVCENHACFARHLQSTTILQQVHLARLYGGARYLLAKSMVLKLCDSFYTDLLGEG